MRVEIWSDIACPWCYIGKRRFEAALARFPERDDIEVVWRSFELNPSAPRVVEGDYATRLAAKYGASRPQAEGMIRSMTETAADDGVELRFDRIRPGNTFDGHRLLHLAAAHGFQDALKEQLLRAYLTEGEAIGDPATLRRIAVGVGLDDAEVAAVLASESYADAVRADEAEAMDLGISAVPSFVVDRRFVIPGAQPVDVCLATLEKARAARALTVVRPTGPAGDAGCDGDSCTT